MANATSPGDAVSPSAIPAEGQDGTRPRGKRGPTLEEIVGVASRLFSSVGYVGTSMRDIARDVGIKPASLYAHFASKEEILWHIVSRATLALEELQDEAMSRLSHPVERFRAFIRNHALYHATYPRESKIANVEIYSLSRAHFQEIVAFRRRYEVQLQEIITAGQKHGYFEPYDAKLTSYALLQMGIGISYWYGGSGRATPEDVAALWETLALNMVGAATVHR
jgi:AcrR family transcriptional regulator